MFLRKNQAIMAFKMEILYLPSFFFLKMGKILFSVKNMYIFIGFPKIKSIKVSKHVKVSKQISYDVDTHENNRYIGHPYILFLS